nr:uncharacterized protein LOC112285693 isoform X2 [Physcomitrium patens]|eukprot:XP_024382462.1 uncharacterized protein LOC112285693 isoform X2 [Physcomitrella patens]
MKRKRHQRSGPDGLVPEEEEEPGTEAQHDVEDEDRLKRLLEAAGAAMPEVSDGDGDGEAPADSHLVHSEDPMSDSKVEKTVLAESVMTIVAETAEEEMALTEIVPNMRRCGLCGGTTDGEPAADNPSEVADGQANGCVKPHDESCLADVTLDTKKADGFGAGTGWLGRLLGPLGEQFGVGGVWVHENCAIWSPEVYFSGFGRLKNVKAALRRGRLLRCSLCNHPGATIGCRVDRCPQNYHLPCARAEGCMFNHRKYLMACYDHSYLFKRRRKKRYWVSKSGTVQQDGTQQEHSNLPRISKTQRRAAAAAARLKDIEAEEKYLDKAEEDEEFVRRERKRLQRDLAQIAPLKLGGGSHGSNQGVAPEGWDSVAGLQDVVQCLKEMVTLPLLYPETFTRLGISAPRGVLLHGHPGTGKTLVVRALAGACSRGGQQVAYFARKGADILGKYVGDSERQLRLLFQVAEQCQPAIIFFDEIDGLAPSRCGDRDQTQSSVVSTLLALMDGLSSRGSVVVIGATNRPDSLDPALRRPGRFDREIYFPLPSTEDRASILRLHTRTWNPAPSSEILAAVAKATPGFAGADLQALCVEAAMTALRRVVPLKYILDSAALKESLEIRLPSLPSIQVKAKDWAKAVARAPLPCSRRLASSSLTHVPATPLPRHLAPALLPILVELVVKLGLDARVSLPPLLAKAFYLTELALTAESNLQNTECSYFSNKGVILPEKWQTMVVDCFKDTTSGLGKALEYAFLDTGIMFDAYGAPHYSQPASTVRFENAGIAADEGWVTSKNSRGPSNYEGLSSSRRISNDNDLDEMDTAAQQKWPGCKFRVLLLGGAKQGQKLVAGAVISGFEGLAQTRTLSLPAMLMEGGGDMEQGLIYIIGEARRSAPCVLYMPKIEDWVVSKDKNGKNDMSGIVKHPEGFGISNARAEDSLHERFRVNSKNGDEAPRDISVAWKVMKQQLQTMPPDTQLMLLATCESGVESLPLEVVNYFSPQFERTSSISSVCAAKVSPCVLVEFSSNYELKSVLEKASQDIASVLASGFGSRMARLREEYIAGCSAEKPKFTNAVGVRLPTSLQQAIANKVSQIRTRVREDLGRDLRNIGQDWARILGGSPYANDLAKVFGMDVGRGLGLDLGLEFKNLEFGLVEEANKECNIDVGGKLAAVDKNAVGASCTIGCNERSSLGILEDHQRSAHCKDAEFVISGGRSLNFNEVDVNEHGTMRKTLHLQDLCTSTDRMNDTRIHPVGWDKEQREGQPTSESLGTAKVGDSMKAAEESSATWTSQRKALQSAIAFCGYRLLRDPQLAGLRSATTMLKRVPVVDINEGM